jgi:outer membrane lipoprotein-sorting protein
MVSSGLAGEEVDRLLSEYAKIETVTCQVRRTVDSQNRKIKFLSRIYYTNKNQLHVENLTPVKRRTIADGKHLHQYGEGDPKGFSRPVSELSEPMAISLQKVPGTAMDHLIRLKGMNEQQLPNDSDTEKRVGIDTGKQYVVLLLDEEDRLKGIDFYKSSEMKDKTADYDYSDFQEVLTGVWVPFRHLATLRSSNGNHTETVRVDSFIANKPVAESLFIAASFFDKEIDFVDSFEKIYPE